MTGEEWLATAFEPVLGEERIRFSNVVDDLAGGLRALEACGLLDAARVADCRSRLHAAHQEANRQPLPDVRPPGSVADRPRNLLRHVLAPPITALADVDGVTVVLASVELWTGSVRVRATGLNNATSDRLDEEFGQALTSWGDKAREHRERGGAPNGPPRNPGERLLRLHVTLADDVGTEYKWTGGSAGGSGSEWRLEQTFEPCVPEDATQLTLKFGDPDGRLVTERQLGLPGR